MDVETIRTKDERQSDDYIGEADQKEALVDIAQKETATESPIASS